MPHDTKSLRKKKIIFNCWRLQYELCFGYCTVLYDDSLGLCRSVGRSFVLAMRWHIYKWATAAVINSRLFSPRLFLFCLSHCPFSFSLDHSHPYSVDQRLTAPESRAVVVCCHQIKERRSTTSRITWRPAVLLIDPATVKFNSRSVWIDGLPPPPPLPPPRRPI